MTTIRSVLILLSFAVTTGLSGETLFGPGTVNIATNEAILVNSMSLTRGGYECYLDGFPIDFDIEYGKRNERFAIAGAHSFSISNLAFITFQRLQGSSIKTAVVGSGTTNTINIPSGKTVQFFAPNITPLMEASVLPNGSTNVYMLFSGDGYVHPSVTGPATITLTPSTRTYVLSYYLSDEVLQFPPQGFLRNPAPQLEVNIEKSQNLTNWIVTGTFNTEAEAGAFYRLHILQ